jgi:hypothetical protein
MTFMRAGRGWEGSSREEVGAEFTTCDIERNGFKSRWKCWRERREERSEKEKKTGEEGGWGAYNEFAAIVVFHLIGKMRRKSSQLGTEGGE